METAKRIMIIGGTGSGKSTIAKKISERLGIPCYHLDKLFWESPGKPHDRSRVNEEIAKLYQSDAWVIDGNYSDSWNERASRADVVIFMDISSALRAYRLIKRSLVCHNGEDGSLRGFDWKLFKYAMEYHSGGRQKALKFIESDGVREKTVWLKDRSPNPFLARS